MVDNGPTVKNDTNQQPHKPECNMKTTKNNNSN